MQDIINIAIIPAYEPSNDMINLLKELKKENLKIILIDDGSGKEYENVFAKSEEYATVLCHQQNYGKGIAIKTALKYIKENYKGQYNIVTLDCDGQHSAGDVKRILKEVENNSKKIVIGKRIRSKKTPLRSKLGNSITRLIYHFVTGIDVYDTQTGLRAFSNEIVDFLEDVNGERYEYEMNVLLECARNNIDIKEFEIKAIYIDNNSNSHFDTLKDSLRIYNQILKFSCSSLISFFIDYTLFIIFNMLLNKVILSNIFSRCISATVNYIINRKIVFKSEGKIFRSIVQYFLLAMIILTFNTLILNFLVEHLLINKYLAKVITEIISFFINWLMQKKVIFK